MQLEQSEIDLLKEPAIDLLEKKHMAATPETRFGLAITQVLASKATKFIAIRKDMAIESASIHEKLDRIEAMMAKQGGFRKMTTEETSAKQNAA